MSYFCYQSKRIYYTEIGNGKPVLLLHGNTASSRPLLTLYKNKFHVILMDFLGHGKSECDIYECCINQRKYGHCGQCEELPCAL